LDDNTLILNDAFDILTARQRLLSMIKPHMIRRVFTSEHDGRGEYGNREIRLLGSEMSCNMNQMELFTDRIAVPAEAKPNNLSEDDGDIAKASVGATHLDTQAVVIPASVWNDLRSRGSRTEHSSVELRISRLSLHRFFQKRKDRCPIPI